MKYASVLFIVLISATVSYAGESIYFKVANDQGSINFSNFTSMPAIHPMVQEIAVRTLKKPFTPGNIRTEYYQVQILRGVMWQGMSVVQYDYIPLNKDRFRHVFWVGQDSEYVYKLDIYDLDGKLLYSAVSLDETGKSDLDEVKKKLPDGKKGYFGFLNVYTETHPDGTVRMLFTDGLNRFSVFRSPYKGSGKNEEKLIVYGNYVYNKNIDTYRYTVVGTIPFYKMEEVVALLSDTADAEDTLVSATVDNQTKQKEEARDLQNSVPEPNN